ncbi:MAG: peptidylprolyl isomerase [bacterium]|nr:peptidylprolyl isomerase [bacterium]
MNYFPLMGLCSILFVIGAGCVNMTPEVSSNIIVDEVKNTKPITMTYAFPGTLDAERIDNKQVRLETEKGTIVFELFADTAPKTVSNFVYLADEGYFDGLTFHRRVENFVIQGGDPQGTGTGGPGYRFEDELDDAYAYDRGIVAMANAGPDTNGSQFFIMLADTPLPKAYSIFGRVTEGIDVIDSILIGDKMTKVTIEEKTSE